MSWKDTLLNLVVESDNPKNGKPATPAPVQPPAVGIQPGGPATPATALNADILNTLMGVINNRTTAYTTLIATATTLAEFIPSEDARLKAAIKTANVTPEQIRAAAVIHVADIDSAVNRFKLAQNEQSRTRVTGVRTDAEQAKAKAKALTEQATAMRAQIATLESEAAAAALEATRLEGAAAAAEAELTALSDTFVATAKRLQETLSAQVNTFFK